MKRLMALSAALLIAAPAAAEEIDYRNMAQQIASVARKAKMEKILLGTFEPGGFGQEEEAAYARAKVLRWLSQEEGVEVVDLDGAGHLRAGVSGKTPQERDAAFYKKLKVGMIVSASVFGGLEETEIILRLQDPGTGRVLASAEAKVEARFQKGGLSLGQIEPVMPPDIPGDLRDALSTPKEKACGERFKELARFNEAMVETKARYWAARLREPGFSYSGLTRNPGSEIKDRGIRSRFYDLLAKWHEGSEPPPLSAQERRKLEALMKREKKLIDECGIH